MVVGRAETTLFGARQRSIEMALRSGAPRSIALDMRGCFGWCPVYTATFAASGIATILDRGPHCRETAKAEVPFARVLEAARQAGAARLRPYYPIRSQDTVAARITLVTHDSTYVSDAPDASSWGTAFVATQSRLDQIVRDTAWMPRIDLKACAGGAKRGPV